MSLLYNAGIYLFKAAVGIASLRSAKIKEMRAGELLTLAQLSDCRRRVAPEGFDVWIHAASLGEFEQGRPLIERIKRENPKATILLTFFSPSGYRVRRDYKGVDAVYYLPLDTPGEVRRFLDAAAPHKIFFVKYEFWGNYLGELHRRGVPTYIISAIFRRRQRFFRFGGGVFRRMLRCFDRIYVQDENSRLLLESIGITNVTVAGDTRFDRVTDIRRNLPTLPEAVKRFAAEGDFTLVAGSTWPPDEALIFPWMKRHEGARLIIAPHEFDDRRIADIIAALGCNAVRLSDITAGRPLPADCRAIVVDCFGLLSALYSTGSAAYVGGGFGVGIHNINEAAVYGIPVAFGPNHSKFKEASDLIAAGGGFEIADSAAFEATMTRMLSDNAARAAAGKSAGDYIASHIGATDIIYNDIF